MLLAASKAIEERAASSPGRCPAVSVVRRTSSFGSASLIASDEHVRDREQACLSLLRVVELPAQIHDERLGVGESLLSLGELGACGLDPSHAPPLLLSRLAR